jgi:DNA-binding response OmpR family regulator
MRIFLMDDDSEFRNIITIFLEMRGYEVTSAADPTFCAVYDKPDQPCPLDAPCTDILLTDQNMPKMTGLEFIQTQQKRGCKGSRSYKALLSANLSDAEQQLATELGCTIFRKPFRLYSLLAWIESIESRHAPGRALVDFADQRCP